jgi:Ca2+-binding EF-hand superfamily protein
MVSSISGYSSASAMAMTRPDPSQMASKLFSRLDSKGQGFIEQSDLQSAFSQVFGNASSSEANDASSQLFSALDGDSNGKVTESEFSNGMQKLAEALDSQAFSSRMGGAGGMPPPPPPGGGQDDAGFTKDELQSQLEEIGSTDSKRSSLISSVVENFDKADANGDGKVSATEAMAYEQSTQSSTSGSSTQTGSTGSASSSSQTDAMLAHRLMELMRAYGGDSTTSVASSVLSVSA